MRSEIDYFKIEANHVAPEQGNILIAEPFLADNYFKRSIVYLVGHGTEGSVGFILNKPVSMKIVDLIPDFPSNDFSLSLGGPVSPNTIHYIHTLGDIIPDSVRVKDDIYWSGDFDVVKQLIAAKKINKSQIRFFIGYSGWSPGQLENEIDQNSWLIHHSNNNFIMKNDKEHAWSKILYDLGGKYIMWANSPENPSMN